MLGIAQDDFASKVQYSDAGEFAPPPLEESFDESELGDQEEQPQQIITEDDDDDNDDILVSNDVDYQKFEASFEYEIEGATLNVTLFDDTNSNTVEIIPLLQDPLQDIPEPSNEVIRFKIPCYELKAILKDCFKTGSNFQLNGYQHEITVLRFSSRNEYRSVEVMYYNYSNCQNLYLLPFINIA